MSNLTIVHRLTDLCAGLDTLVLVARGVDASAGWPLDGLDPAVVDLANRLGQEARPGVAPLQTSLLPPGQAPRRLGVVALRDEVSRHLSPTRSYEISAALKGALKGRGPVGVMVAVADRAHAAAVVAGVARCLPLYDRKTSNGGAQDVRLLVRDETGPITDEQLALVAESTQRVCRLVDMPPAELDCERLELEARAAVDGLVHVQVESIVGDALLDAGLRGLHAVGRTATAAPRLVLLDYNPPGASATVALIGKGLVYDTGGLSLKIVGDRMLTMKCDMAGSAAVIGAFRLLAAAGVGVRVVAGLGVAENAIGPASYRPDDVIVMHSGRTVEINNTDAEGRLALADAASYVARRFQPRALIDAATLTGAQLMATGRNHAGVVSNRAEVEALALRAGLTSGDHCLAMLWSPELMEPEFKSKVADMRNSVGDRMNAPSAAAGWFVWSHIADLDLAWLHVDLAGPAFVDNRATGYGTLLLRDAVRALAAG